MLRQYELVDLVKSYDPDADEDALNRAYVFAMKKHGAQLRTSGDPYYSHPVEVAGILTKFKLDSVSIIAGLLHDTVEDTDTTVEEVRELFGDQVAQIVDGLTKLAKIEQKSANNKQAENFRKLLLAMSEDIRVLLIKLADRLHNMRTLHFCAPEKRARIARETLDIYAPLAERIGMQEVKSELEEIAFAELHKEAHDSIVARLNFLREKDSNLVPKIIEQLQKDMEENGIKAVVSGREKTPYSIWRKMQQKNASFEQLSDIMAFRIIVDDVATCYQALGIVHSKYHMVPRRFKDYISTPKPNGYQSIHTGVIGPENTRIEIQIRTHEMHEIGEKGVAAHWAYKQGKKPKARISAGYASCWRFWNRHRIPKSFWRTPNWKCIMTRCSVLRRRAILSVCRSIQRRSILPMRCIRRSAIPASARKSTAKFVRCGPFCKTATRWKF